MSGHPAKNAIFKDAVKLISGTMGARIILVAIMPLLTRLYDPDDFALLAVCMAIMSTISVVGCLRFEAAIPLAADERDAANILLAALASLTLVCSLLGIIALTFDENITTALNTPAIKPYLWLLVLGIGAIALNAALQGWAVRQKRFGQIARTKATQTGFGAAIMVGFGALGLAPLGLVLGNICALGAGSMSLLSTILRNDRKKFAAIRIAEVWTAAIRYRRYPMIASIEALTNVAATQVPILIIAAHLTDGVGQLFLAMQIMALPITLVGASVAQIYTSHARENLERGNLSTFTAQIIANMSRLGFMPIMLIAAAAPLLFSWVFGAEWQSAGQIAVLLAPWMFMQLLSGPISSVMLLRNKHATFLAAQLCALIFRVGAVLIAVALSPDLVITAYAISGAVVCIGTLIMYTGSAGIDIKTLARSMAPITLIGKVAALATIAIYIASLAR